LDENDFLARIEGIVERDGRYRPEAYAFVMRALSHTVSGLEAPRHVTGQELLSGIRGLALEEYGPMAKSVFEHWGVRRSVDFGHLVFNLVGEGLLGKTETDRIEDFEEGFDFEEALVRDYPWTGGASEEPV
jgi:uncharacterized repeat protein (TIGR04138 family)